MSPQQDVKLSDLSDVMNAWVHKVQQHCAEWPDDQKKAILHGMIGNELREKFPGPYDSDTFLERVEKDQQEEQVKASEKKNR